MLSRFHLIPEHYGQTDRQIRFAISVSRVSMLMCNKNRQTKNITLFVYSRRVPMISIILGMVIEEVCAIFAPDPNFSRSHQ